MEKFNSKQKMHDYIINNYDAEEATKLKIYHKNDNEWFLFEDGEILTFSEYYSRVF